MSLNSIAYNQVKRNLNIRSVDVEPTNYFARLIRYIPSESIGIYIAAIGARGQLKAVFNFTDVANIYWACALFTLVISIL